MLKEQRRSRCTSDSKGGRISVQVRADLRVDDLNTFMIAVFSGRK